MVRGMFSCIHFQLCCFPNSARICRFLEFFVSFFCESVLFQLVLFFFEVISCGDQCETVQSVLFDSFLGSLIRGYCEWDFLDFLSCVKLLRYVDVVGTLSDVEWALSNGRDLIR